METVSSSNTEPIQPVQIEDTKKNLGEGGIDTVHPYLWSKPTQSMKVKRRKTPTFNHKNIKSYT